MKSYHDDEAKYEASRLSHNIYYETQFSCSSLRVFLDSLPGVVSIYATVNIIDGITHYELSSIQVNFMKHTPILIIPNSMWQLNSYWPSRHVRIIVDQYTVINS